MANAIVKQASSAMVEVRDWETMQRMATALTHSSIIPEEYRLITKKKQNISGHWQEMEIKNAAALGNAIIAIDLAQRLNMSPLAVMQNLYIIQGRPSWSSQFIIASINSCGRFTPLKFRVSHNEAIKTAYQRQVGYGANKKFIDDIYEGENTGWQAYSTEIATGELIEGPVVNMAMALAEGWYGKGDSKWQTMPDLMGRYRAAAFFGRFYAPDIMIGMTTAEEARDIAGSNNESRAMKPAAPSKNPLEITADEADADDDEAAAGADASPSPAAKQPLMAEKPKAKTPDTDIVREIGAQALDFLSFPANPAAQIREEAEKLNAHYLPLAKTPAGKEKISFISMQLMRAAEGVEQKEVETYIQDVMES